MIKKEVIEYLNSIDNEAIHGKNILAKLRYNYGDNKGFQNESQLQIFYDKYKDFRENILKLIPNTEKNINKIVDELNKYKIFVNENSHFSAQSKYEPTILEEFIFYLFKNLIDDNKIKYGSVNAYCNLYFSPKNLKSFISNPSIKINTKDQDFSIYRHLEINAEDEKQIVNVPIISIECKTYLDKTMLEGSIATAEKVKMGNPHTKYCIVTETYEVDYSVDISFSRIDQIYVLRKQKRKGTALNPINSDVLLRLYRDIKSHLNSEWIDTEKSIINNGIVL